MTYFRPHHKPGADLFDEIVVDSFAGGGGASMGIEDALGRSVDIAINHDPEAVAQHRVNHPHTRHYCESIFDVDPVAATAGRRVGLLWASPDCTHHSKARGGKPTRDAGRISRGLAWIILRWAGSVRPRVIIMENVEEFRQWGPLTRKRGRKRHPRACRFRKSRTFDRWCKQLRDLGYAVDHRELRACDFGAPTIRRRFFLVARCDGQPITWPEVTHGDIGHSDNGAKTRAVGEREERRRCTAAQGETRGGRLHGSCEPGYAVRESHTCSDGASRRPRSCREPRSSLKPYRTAADCIDWSIPCPSIFLTKEQGKAIGVKRPLADNTLRRIAAGVQRYVIDAAEPFIVATNHGDSGGRRTYPIDEPMRTVCASCRGGEALVVPTLVQTGYGEREGQAPRVPGLHKPLGTVVAGGSKHALVSAFLSYAQHGGATRDITQPAHTITASTKDQNQLIAAHLINQKGVHQTSRSMRDPVPTVCASTTHAGLVAALLVKFYGEGGQWQDMRDPMHTIPTKDRFGLVTVNINGEPYIITDIGMRMLQPRELYRAQGFPDDYVIDHGIDAERRPVTLTKTAQVRMCGNSVCPPMATALVRANYQPMAQPAKTTEVA